MPTEIVALAAKDTSGVLETMTIERRDVAEHDVDIQIKYCGICRSDLHLARGQWPESTVPGHEITGIVTNVGDKVTKFKKGDRVGVTVFVDSCRMCTQCKKGDEQYCEKDPVYTYNSKLLHGYDSEVTYGGYSQSVVVDENYVLRIPDELDLATAAPIVCAGVTTYSPLKHFGAMGLGAAGVTGIVGFGGLGHMAAKLARAMGNKVLVFSTSTAKQAAVEALGATFVYSKDPLAMKAVEHSCHMILDTASADHEVSHYFGALTVDGKYCVVGSPQAAFTVHAFRVIKGRRTLCGSNIGSIKETQEVLDFCAAHGIKADVQIIEPKDCNHAMASLAKYDADVRRFVVDMEKLSKDTVVEPDPAIDASKWRMLSDVVPASARHPSHVTASN